MFKKAEKCRICGNTRLQCVLDLGQQMLTGVFPRAKNANITMGPLRLVKCVGGDEVCGLLQLQHSYDLREMYGENYGYRSGLNASMVAHLHNKVKRILGQVQLNKGDLVVDIGSNDSTTLQAYPAGPVCVGIDPTGVKFSNYYPAHIQLIPDFFSAAVLKERFPGKKAKVITSFSMLYDLEDPISFMREVHDVLADDGVWMFEQSYMPTMLETNSYDTVCHEHLEFYALRQIKWMAAVFQLSHRKRGAIRAFVLRYRRSLIASAKWDWTHLRLTKPLRSAWPNRRVTYLILSGPPEPKGRPWPRWALPRRGMSFCNTAG